ncbi:MAG: ABC transporter permease subunit [Gemmobacter sp.]|nr:ABC transporter permease subunit [Gemmobacter sp.]
MQVALTLVAVALVVGSTLGAIAGLDGGVLDTILMRIMDVQLAFPLLLLALIFMTILGPDFAMRVVALPMVFWINFARVGRSETLRIRNLEFIYAAITMGMPRLRIIFTDVLPNVLPTILVVAALCVPLVVLSEAGFHFRGLGWNRRPFHAA